MSCKNTQTQQGLTQTLNQYISLIYPIVKEKAFPAEHYSEQNRILLAILCTYQGVLPQGAPTSPAISNIIMRGFDDTMGKWCNKRGILYTRYCDDMTFSGKFDPKVVIDKTASELKKLGLYLNADKTVVAKNGQKKLVTGIIVNQKVSIPRAYKRKIRQEIYYCMKYGLTSHMEHNQIRLEKHDYVLSLLGKVNYASSVEASNTELAQYRDWLIAELKATIINSK